VALGSDSSLLKPSFGIGISAVRQIVLLLPIVESFGKRLILLDNEKKPQ
jgi:hypothetical protein